MDIDFLRRKASEWLEAMGYWEIICGDLTMSEWEDRKREVEIWIGGFETAQRVNALEDPSFMLGSVEVTPADLRKSRLQGLRDYLDFKIKELNDLCDK